MPNIWVPEKDAQKTLERVMRAKVWSWVEPARSPFEIKLTALFWATPLIALTLTIVGVSLERNVPGIGTGLGVLALMSVASMLWTRHFIHEGKEAMEQKANASREQLVRAGVRAGMALIHERQTDAKEGKFEESHAFRLPPPPAQPYGVSHQGAESFVADWMRHLGELDAEATRYSGDGGIDVASSRYIAQVKNYAGTVPVEAIRAMAGVANVDDRIPLFFTSGAYSAAALDFADRAGMALFKYDAVSGTMSGANTNGEMHIRRGL